MARAKKIVAVSGTAPKKGQLPAGLVRWLKANGRLGRGAAVMLSKRASAGATSRRRKRGMA